MPDYPSSFTGTFTNAEIVESFRPRSGPGKFHDMDGNWAFAMTYSTTPTQTTYAAGTIPLRGHGALLLGHIDVYSWEVTGYVPAPVMTDPEFIGIPEQPVPRVCVATGSVRAKEFYLWLFHGALSEDSSTAVVDWAEGSATGVATKLTK